MKLLSIFLLMFSEELNVLEQAGNEETRDHQS